MNLRQYIEGLTKVLEQNPELQNLRVVAECNDIHKEVKLKPSLGNFQRNSFTENTAEEFNQYELIINAVCID